MPPLKGPFARRLILTGLASTVMVGAPLCLGLAACTPTIRLEVAPIQIYAKLDADVRVKLDKELQDLLVQNPNLF